jgi:shikimate dehydrogenase
VLKAGLLGYPISHSLSPAIHNAAYEALRLDWNYALYPGEDVSANEAIIAEAKKNPQAYVGFNVTTPYKREAFEACDQHSLFAEAAGSANVLTFLSSDPSKGVLKGDNTDGRGLLAAIQRELGFDARASSVVICGTGPVALSALFALIHAEAASVSVVSRNPSKGREQVQKLSEHLAIPHGLSPAVPKVQVIGYEQIALPLESADLLINATTVGMKSGDGSVVPPELLKSELAVFDVIYGHGESALIKQAREIGAKACDGVGMLVEQAALTIEIWAEERGITVKAPRELMYRVALEELTKRSL